MAFSAVAQVRTQFFLSKSRMCGRLVVPASLISPTGSKNSHTTSASPLTATPASGSRLVVTSLTNRGSSIRTKSTRFFPPIAPRSPSSDTNFLRRNWSSQKTTTSHSHLPTSSLLANDWPTSTLSTRLSQEQPAPSWPTTSTRKVMDRRVQGCSTRPTTTQCSLALQS